MPYEDEPFIRAMNDYKKGQQGDLETGIYIREELYEFERQSLFDESISMMLPKAFVDMPLELAKIKYPMEQRPAIIKMNEGSDINFTFNLLDIAVKNENIEQIKAEIKQALKRANPSNVFYEDKLEVIGEQTLGWFDYKSHGLDQKIYNLMYFLPVAGKLLHGVFNSALKDTDSWKPVVLQVIRSIENVTTKEN